MPELVLHGIRSLAQATPLNSPRHGGGQPWLTADREHPPAQISIAESNTDLDTVLSPVLVRVWTSKIRALQLQQKVRNISHRSLLKYFNQMLI